MSKSVLPVALVMGVVSGLLVAAFFNVITVPVMEWAITLEGEAAEAEAAASGGASEEEGGIAVSLGMQRIGMTAGLVVIGVLAGAIFTGLYQLVRRATPGWNIWAWATIAADSPSISPSAVSATIPSPGSGGPVSVGSARS